MKRRAAVAILAGAAFWWPLAARAQQKGMPVIGFLRSTGRDESGVLLEGFRQGLKETGYVEGREVAIEYRWAEGHHDRLPALAADLVRRQVNVIIAGGNEAVVAARAATEAIPIVFALGDDPIRLGFVASLNRPGGNITGVSFLTTELVPKRMELLCELVPGIATVAYAQNPNSPGSEVEMNVVQMAAHALGQQSVVVEIGSDSELDAVFASLAQQRVGGLLVGSGAFFFARRDRLAALAAKHRIPAIYDLRDYVKAGGLMSYGASITDAYQQVGVYAGRILKGEKPADLPVEQPVRFELVINVKTGKALGLTIPQSVLARADGVIE